MMFDFKLDKESFIDLSTHVLKGYTSGDRNVLAYKIEDGRLFMVGQSSVAHFEGSIPAEHISGVEETETFSSLEGREVRGLIQVLKADETCNEVRFSTNSKINKNIVVSTPESRISIRTHEGDLVRPLHAYKEIGEVDAIEFFGDLSDMGKVVEKPIANSFIPANCLHLFIKDDGYVMMGTDQWGLAERTRRGMYTLNSSLEELSEFDGAIMIRQSELKLFNLSGLNALTANLLISNYSFGYKIGDFIALVGVADEIPAIYEPIKELANGENYIDIKTSSLKRAIQGLRSANKDSEATRFKIQGNTLIVYSIEGNKPDIFSIPILSEVPSDYDGVEFCIARSGLNAVFGLIDKEPVLRFAFYVPVVGTVIRLIPLDHDFVPVDPNSFYVVSASDR